MKTVSEIEILITSYVRRRNSNITELAKVSGIGRTSLYRCFKYPSCWRLGSLLSIYDYLGIPKEERIFTTK